MFWSADAYVEFAGVCSSMHEVFGYFPTKSASSISAKGDGLPLFARIKGRERDGEHP